MAATILKWLGFKVVSWMQDFWPCTAMVCIVGLVWLHHTHYLGDATMATKACNLLQDKNDLQALLALGMEDLWISFEPLGRFS
jgi:hypothetical protein